MIAMDDIQVEFNGVDLLKEYGIAHVSVDGPQTHIFAGSKSIQTARPMYRSRQILTSSVGEPLNFSLTFAPLDREWSDELVNIIYQLFDVVDFKPLRFGGEEMYYNVIPHAGSIAEMRLFAMNGGYVTIAFQADAPHGWIDREYSFIRNEDTAGYVWEIENPTNVKDKWGLFKTYPFIEVKDFNPSHVSELDKVFIHFWDSAQGDYEQATNSICIDGITVTENTILLLDCYNQQVHYQDNITGREENILEYLNPIRFFYLHEGVNRIYHSAMWYGSSWEQSPIAEYTVNFYFSAPYMK